MERVKNGIWQLKTLEIRRILEKCLQNRRFCNRENLRFSHASHFSNSQKSKIFEDFGALKREAFGAMKPLVSMAQTLRVCKLC